MVVDLGKGAPPREGKRAYVRAMFSAIAPRYDLLNTLLSFGLHRRWKQFAADLAAPPPGGTGLDVCCGTGDLAFLLKARVGSGGRVVGVDFAGPMLEIARARAGHQRGVWFVQGDAEALPVPDGAFDAVTVGFGVRNLPEVERALRELRRVLRPGGRLVILEFARARNRLFRILYDLYSFTVIPALGRRLSHHPDAYLYLPVSIRTWPDQEAFSELLRDAGFVRVRVYDLLWGAVAVYVGQRPEGEGVG